MVNEGEESQGCFSPRREPAPHISVVIPHYNDVENLDRCLSLLSGQSMPADQFEIVVADNNSLCGLAAVERVCSGRARVVPAAIQGAGAARNAGVGASRGSLLAFIDSDCRPSFDWLKNGVEALAKADMVGGLVDVHVADSANPTAVEAFELVFAFNFKHYVEKEGYSGGGNMFVTRAVFDKVGGFRASVVEDMDWGHRAVELGYHWRYAPQARVSHPARRDWADLLIKWRRMTDEFYLISIEKPFGRARWIVYSWLVLVSPFAHLITVLRSNKLNHIGLRLKAIAVLFRIRIWRFFQCYRVLLQAPSGPWASAR